METIPPYPPFLAPVGVVTGFDSGLETYGIEILGSGDLELGGEYEGVPQVKVAPVGTLIRKMVACYGVTLTMPPR